MTLSRTLLCTFTLCLIGATSAEAACEGNLGRGWASNRGAGKYTMAASDKSCTIGYANFYDEGSAVGVPATEIKLSRAPQSGKIGIAAGKGVVYTPTPGFRGEDRFCTVNTAPGRGGKLSGCVTVTVN